MNWSGAGEVLIERRGCTAEVRKGFIEHRAFFIWHWGEREAARSASDATSLAVKACLVRMLDGVRRDGLSGRL